MRLLTNPLIDYSESSLPDNTTGLITPEVLRTVLNVGPAGVIFQLLPTRGV